jgi:diguanylate cyclase (GGDEF)-like protein/PAS domain S-box-containing protein
MSQAMPESRLVPTGDTPNLHTLVIDSLDEHIAVIDTQGAIVDVNGAWREFGAANGLAPEYLCGGANYLDALADTGDDDDSFASRARLGLLEVICGERDAFYHEYPCHSPDEKRWFMMRVFPLKQSARQFFVVAHQDITQRKLAEEMAEHASLHDPLTGLANRRYFNKFLQTEFQRSIRERSSISLIELDVDHFKDFNDELGHPAGDHCLIQVGRVLLNLSQRPTDLAVRLGGDEFALILGDTNAAGARKVTDALQAAISRLGFSNGKSGELSISVGVASVHPQGNQEESLLLREADRALYDAKAAGRNQVKFSGAGSESHA